MEQRGTHVEQSLRSNDWIAEYQLRDGGVVRFRHVRPADEVMIADAIRTASRETLLHRFFSPIRDLPAQLLRPMLDLDRSKGICIVGVLFNADRQRIICGARYVRLEDPQNAEMAMTVHDDFQRRGLGRFMLKLLVDLARADGIRRIEADVMASNAGMLKLLHSFQPHHAEWQRAGEVYHVGINIA